MTTHTNPVPAWATRVEQVNEDGEQPVSYYRHVLATQVPVGNDDTVTFDINGATDAEDVALSCDAFHLDVPMEQARSFAEGILAAVNEAEGILGVAVGGAR